MSALRDNILNIERSAIDRISCNSLHDPDVIPLWFGESDRVTPEFIREAAKKALDDGQTFYDASQGTRTLKDAIKNYTKRIYQVDLDQSRITVPGAAMLSVMVALQCVVRGRPDNVVCVSPIWPNIFQAVRALDATEKHVRLDLTEDGWSLDLDKLFDACDENTKAIFVASPGNPTGWIMNVQEQRTLLNFARDKGIAIISDEVYGRFDYAGGVAPSFLTMIEDDDLVFVINTLSKAWAMTGWRIGWMVAPPKLSCGLTTLSAINNTGATVFAQYGAAAALNDGEGLVADMVKQCRRGCELAEQILGAHPRVSLPPIAGSFFAFPKIDGVDDSYTLAKRILTEAKVGVAPGYGFGPENDGYIRLCLAINESRLEEALTRVVRVIDQ